MTKSFIGIIYGFMFNDKLIKPKDKVYKYIDEWNKKDYNKITFDELLTHKSGLIDDQYTTNLYKAKNIIEYCINRPIKRENKWRYSNSGYNILGYLVKKITNKSPSKYLKSKINIKLKWEKLQGFEPGFAHIVMKGNELIKFIKSIYHNEELYKIIKYCIKNKYSIYKKNHIIHFQDGYGGQEIYFNKSNIFLHLRIIKHMTEKEYKEYVNKYIEFSNTIISQLH
jgi:hypothetical protein